MIVFLRHPACSPTIPALILDSVFLWRCFCRQKPPCNACWSLPGTEPQPLREQQQADDEQLHCRARAVHGYMHPARCSSTEGQLPHPRGPGPAAQKSSQGLILSVPLSNRTRSVGSRGLLLARRHKIRLRNFTYGAGFVFVSSLLAGRGIAEPQYGDGGSIHSSRSLQPGSQPEPEIINL